MQLELLQLFALGVPDADLLEIKRLLAGYYAKKAMDGADAWWEENNWTDDDVTRMLNTKMRASKQ